MAATQSEIRGWLTRKHSLLGNKIEDCSHVIIYCDTFDYTDYPVYVLKTENIEDVMKTHNDRLMEVYSLSMDIEAQLNEYRAYHIQ